MKVEENPGTQLLPPFYAALEHALAGIDWDAYFRDSWRQFIAARPDDPVGELVAVMLPLGRRSTTLRADPRFRWKW